MTSYTWLLTAFLVVGAGAIAWPDGTARLRRLDSSTRGGTAPGQRLSLPDVTVLVARVSTAAVEHPHRATVVAGATAVAAGWLAGGPVAAMGAGAYTILGTRALTRRSRARRFAAARVAALDDLSAHVADLRAGLPPIPAAAPGSIGLTSGPPISASVPRSPAADGRIAELSAAVWRLAECTGAPAADLLERVEADARAADRSRASAAAQAAGARATALLLAALPAGGIALGYGIGVDPLQVLLHTPLGAACAAGTVLLQSAGLAWAARLAGSPAS